MLKNTAVSFSLNKPNSIAPYNSKTHTNLLWEASCSKRSQILAKKTLLMNKWSTSSCFLPAKQVRCRPYGNRQQQMYPWQCQNEQGMMACICTKDSYRPAPKRTTTTKDHQTTESKLILHTKIKHQLQPSNSLGPYNTDMQFKAPKL